MESKKIIYLKNSKKPSGYLYFPCYWKVVENDDKNTVVLTVQKETINFEKDDDFHDAVSFIKNKLCDSNIGSEGWEEISREQFDEFYKKTVEKLNVISSY
jgi:hypothetical protein